MKKVLSLLLAVVMVIGMLPLGVITAGAAEQSETMTLAGTTGTVSGESISWTSGNLSFTANKNTSSTAIRTSDSDHFRLYVGFSATLTCAAGNITKIVMTTTGSSYTAAPTGADGSVGTVSGTTITIVPNESSNTYTIPTIGKQIRVKTITVYYVAAGEEVCAHANKVEQNDGYAPTCTEVGKTNSVFCNDCQQTITPQSDIPATGHTFAEGVCSVCGVADPSAGIAEADAPIAGVAYKFGMRQNGLTDKPLLMLTGAMNGYYAATTTDVAEAVDTYLEETEGGYYIYTLSDTTKQYINIVVSGTYYNFKYEATGSSVWTLNTEYKYVKTTCTDGTEVYLGTYGTNQTMGASKTTYISNTATIGVSQFCGWFFTTASTGEGGEEACTHTNTTTTTVAATCTEAGSTTVTCDDCGETISTETLEATGHNYVNGTCSVCGDTEQSTGLEGKYYIAAIRSSGNYQYMTNDLGTASTQRYQIVDSGLTELPASIETVVDAQVFELIASGDGYKIKTGDQYLGYTSGNSGTLVDEATAIVATIENGEAAGSYQIHFTTSDAERYLSLNTNAANAYYAWYKLGQVSDLYLVPVAAGAEVCTHTNTTTTTVAATCTEAGSTTVTCDDCGETISTETIEATGHNYVNGTCSGCGENQPTTSNGQYMLVTDAASLAEGDQIVIVAAGSDFALSTNQKSNNRGQVAITKDGNVVEINSDVQILTLEAGTVADTWAFNTGSGYLYAASASSNHLKTQTTNDANGSWSVTIDANGVATVKAQGSNTRNWMRHNSSSSLFACYASGQNDISIYKYTIVDGCVHEVAEDGWTVTTPATCTEDGSKTGTCSKCGETVTKEIPATGHSLSYNEQTGLMECVCGIAYIDTIADAKAYTDTNKVYHFKGIVTYVSGNKVYVEDATGGVLVMFNGEDAAGIALGDELLVSDTMTVYNKLIETTYTRADEYKKLSSGNALPSQTVTLAQLNADTTNEYLAERVVIENVTIGTINTSGNTTLTDAEGNTLPIYKVTGLNADIAEGDTVTVTAVVSTFNGYQLLVNPDTAATDVVEIVTAEPAFAIGTNTYVTMEEALAVYDVSSEYIKLLSDATVNVTLEDGFYLDLNGYTLSGTIINDGYDIYIMDSTTDEYTCDKMGYFNCVDAEGNAVAPKTIVDTNRTGAARRYLAIATENGYTAHRFYLGVTHVSVKPSAEGVGYKAVFAGDDMVKSEIDSFGYSLQVEGFDAVTQSMAGTEMVSGGEVTLRVKNYDADNYGETKLSASVFMVIGDETVTSTTVSYSLREMVELINAAEGLTAEKIEALAAWIAQSETMQTWNVGNIYTAA